LSGKHGLYAGLLLFEYLNHPHNFNFKYQIFLFFLLSLILIWFACFGGFVARLRVRLRRQKEDLAKLNEKLQQAETLLKQRATLMNNADSAMYQAKQLGRNQ
jgi:cell division protein FtsB